MSKCTTKKKKLSTEDLDLIGRVHMVGATVYYSSSRDLIPSPGSEGSQVYTWCMGNISRQNTHTHKKSLKTFFSWCWGLNSCLYI